MDFNDLMFKLHFSVTRIRGSNEYEIYRNYVHDLPRGKVASFMGGIFREDSLEIKNNDKSEQLRKLGNSVYSLKDYAESLKLYTRSLKYATYNTEAYAVALANRSAVFFITADYKNCIRDIDLCLKANYPEDLKPKVFVRRIKCYQRLGHDKEVQRSLESFQDFIDSSEMTAETKDMYTKVADCLRAGRMSDKQYEKKFNVVPELKMNPTFLSASNAVELKFDKDSGCYVAAKEAITRGDTLFVEKGYAFAPFYEHRRFMSRFTCQYCLVKLSSSVPCKDCVKYLYCSERCRDVAWEEFHQWECPGVRVGLFCVIPAACLPLRIILKAVETGFPELLASYEEDVASYGNNGDNYPYVHKLPARFDKIDKLRIMKFAGYSAVLVTYLRKKTDFFERIKEKSVFEGKTDRQLRTKVGGLLLRHLIQYPASGLPVTAIINNDTMGLTEIAVSVYPSMAMMSHSCVPNTTHYFVGDTVVVKALHDISAKEKLTYSYLDLSYYSSTKTFRQEVLKDICSCVCKCQACSDPKMDIGAFNSYLCTKCGGPAVLNESDEDDPNIKRECTCLDCNFKFPFTAKICDREELIKKYISKLRHHHDINDGMRSFEIAKSIYYPLSTLLASVYLELMTYYKEREGNVLKYLEFSKLVIDYSHKRFGEYAFESGVVFYKVCRSAIQLLIQHKSFAESEKGAAAIADVRNFVRKAKVLFNLQYPLFNHRICIMETLLADVGTKRAALVWICETCCQDHLFCHCPSTLA